MVEKSFAMRQPCRRNLRFPAFSVIKIFVKLMQVTLWIYALALRRSWECVMKNWVVSFAPLVYAAGLSLVGSILGPFGIIGGVLFNLARLACISSGLCLIENMVRMGKADFDDFLKGFSTYLWELVQISFILWIPLQVLAMVLASTPNGGLIYFLIKIILYILLNPVPEFIYQTRSSGIELLSASYNFIVENWIEWFLPNIIITVVGYFLRNALSVVTLGLPGFVRLFIVNFGFGLCLTYFMLFRGFLFAELHGTTRRSRVYRYNARSSN